MINLLKKAKIVGLTATALMVSVPAEAFTCRASPAGYLATDASGSVFVGVQDAGITAICNLTTTIGGVSPQACSSWYSAFLTFKSTGKTVLLHYNGSDGGTACNSYRNWETHIPYFVLFE